MPDPDAFRAALLARHCGDTDSALREACHIAVHLDENIGVLLARQSWGYARMGNAYRSRETVPSKPERPAPLDVAPEQSPHG